MYLVVALGNKGEEYTYTRHNAGWILLDAFLGDASWYTNKAKTLDFHKGVLQGEEVAYIKPLTLMNNSGRVVGAVLLKYADIDTGHIILIHDDVDIPLGELRISFGKGAANHNGVASIIQQVATKNIVRVRVGIGSSGRVPLRGYVLGRLKKDEVALLENQADLLHGMLETIVASGVETAMNSYNERKKDAPRGATTQQVN
jgi:PTH1 family peptidyl-tRNA hydrolase